LSAPLSEGDASLGDEAAFESPHSDAEEFRQPRIAAAILRSLRDMLGDATEQWVLRHGQLERGCGVRVQFVENKLCHRGVDRLALVEESNRNGAENQLAQKRRDANHAAVGGQANESGAEIQRAQQGLTGKRMPCSTPAGAQIAQWGGEIQEPSDVQTCMTPDWAKISCPQS